ncbi:membrane-associated HD superfamily phosphohydrolase [Natronobacillus azotifigens]|uniref:VanZ family protein n=1 Tax=Natronobacillus azotifigens TaxID=472978 RepID=A0A9J6REC4_9BACI|nr:VanZ family protein [Natronobacillus azotifigens]MCZ0703813.1 VanZ family protein [Natronobacillus azotifigens]
MNLDYEIIFGIDKLMHFFSFLVLTLFLGMFIVCLSNRCRLNQRLSYLWFILVTIGTLDEFRQYNLSNRSAEFLDAVANMLGVSVGIAILLFSSYLVKNRHHTIIKLLVLYSFVTIPLFLGLLYYNERTFVTVEEPIQEKLRNLWVFLPMQPSIRFPNVYLR